MYKYQYNAPSDNMVVLSSKEWGSLFKNSHPLMQYEVYLMQDNSFVVQHVLSPLGIALFFLFVPFLFPIVCFTEGFKEAKEQYKDIVRQKERGKFAKDVLLKDSEQHKKLKEFIEG